MFVSGNKTKFSRAAAFLWAVSIAAFFMACETGANVSERQESRALFESAFLPPNQLAFVFPGLAEEPNTGSNGSAVLDLIFGSETEPSLLDFAVKSAGRLNTVVIPQLIPVTQLFLESEPVFLSDLAAVWFKEADEKGIERLLVAQRDASGYVTYSFMTRLEGEASTEWRLKIHGSFTPSGALPSGSGTTWINLLQVDGTENGRILILWSKQEGDRSLTLYHYDFRQEGQDDSVPDASYDFWRKDDGRGGLTFGFQPIDIDRGAQGREAMEQIKLSLEWAPTGAGRLEAAIVGGDVEADGFLRLKTTECWDATPFYRTFLDVRGFKGQNQMTSFSNTGNAAACVFEPMGPILLPAAIPLVDDIPLPDEALNW